MIYVYIYTWRVSGLIILPIGWLQATPAELFTRRTLHSIEMLPDLSYQPIVSWWFSNVFTPFSFRGTLSKSLLTGNYFGMLPTNHCQWLFLVPLKGGRWHIIPQLAVYTTYILPSGGLYATYHLLGEPETTLDTGWSYFSTPAPPWQVKVCMLTFRLRWKKLEASNLLRRSPQIVMIRYDMIWTHVYNHTWPQLKFNKHIYFSHKHTKYGLKKTIIVCINVTFLVSVHIEYIFFRLCETDYIWEFPKIVVPQNRCNKGKPY